MLMGSVTSKIILLNNYLNCNVLVTVGQRFQKHTLFINYLSFIPRGTESRLLKPN